MLIVRELTGGLYFGQPSEERTTAAGREAVDSLRFTMRAFEIRRVVRSRSSWCTRRKTTAPISVSTRQTRCRPAWLWRKVVDELRPEYPDVEVEHRLVDACAMVLVTRPSIFDVLVTENMFGDILSDEASVLAGSLGMLPSASIGGPPSMARTACMGCNESIHGSATRHCRP